MAGPDLVDVATAARQLQQGGIVLYPTEAVWGLGCDPFDHTVVMRLLALKQRPVEKGLILIAASLAQLHPLIDWSALPQSRRDAVLATWPGPHTWVVPAMNNVPSWISGAHASVAVRVSSHPVVVALCEAFAGPLVSTSANPAGASAPRALPEVAPALLAAVDSVVSGTVGAQSRPTTIRDARTGQTLRV